MARIVPARPRPGADQVTEQTVLWLEAGLNDEYLVLQDWNGGILILHPSLTACHLQRSRVLDHDLVVTMSGKKAIAMELQEGLSKSETLACVTAAMVAIPSALVAQEVEELLQGAAPGATPYVSGQISPAQYTWRMERAEAASPTVLPKTSPLLSMLRNAAENIINEAPIRVQGVTVECDAITAPDSLLPAIALATALTWGPVVAAAHGTGGFKLRLRRSRATPCGYIVMGIECSAPLLLLLPFMDVVRRARTPSGSYSFDACYADFVAWMEKKGHETEGVDDFDIQMILSEDRSDSED